MFKYLIPIFYGGLALFNFVVAYNIGSWLAAAAGVVILLVGAWLTWWYMETGRCRNELDDIEFEIEVITDVYVEQARALKCDSNTPIGAVLDLLDEYNRDVKRATSRAYDIRPRPFPWMKVK